MVPSGQARGSVSSVEGPPGGVAGARRAERSSRMDVLVERVAGLDVGKAVVVVCVRVGGRRWHHVIRSPVLRRHPRIFGDRFAARSRGQPARHARAVTGVLRAFLDRCEPPFQCGGCSGPRARRASATVSTGAFALTAAETRRDRALVASQPHSSISTPTAVSSRALVSNDSSESQTKVTITTLESACVRGPPPRLSDPRSRQGGLRLRGSVPCRPTPEAVTTQPPSVTVVEE